MINVRTEPEDRDLEFKKLRQTLIKNEYPEHITSKKNDKFIKKRTEKQKQPQQPIEQQATVKKQKKYIVLPYCNPKKDSAIQTHRKEFPTHNINPYNIEIIDRADTNSKIELKEELHVTLPESEIIYYYLFSV